MRRASRVACVTLLAALMCAGGAARAQDIDACIDASEKALTLRSSGKLIDARTSLSTCAAPSCPDAVRTSCQQRLAEISQAIPSIVLFAKDGSGRDVAMVKVTIDGALYADHLDGGAIVLDPGEHEFRFEVAGEEPVVRRFVLHAGEQNRREEIVIGAAPVAPAVPVTPWVAPESTVHAGDQGTAKDGRAQRTIGLAVGGVGVAGLVVGGIFGALSMSAHASYEKSCGSNIGAPPGQCNSTGVNGQNDAATKGTISTVAFIGGGVALAAGAALFLTAPRRASGVHVGVGPGSVLIEGQF